MGQPGLVEMKWAAIIIISQISGGLLLSKPIQIHYLTEFTPWKVKMICGAVRSIWQDEATKLRGAKRLPAQGHSSFAIRATKRELSLRILVYIHQWTHI